MYGKTQAYQGFAFTGCSVLLCKHTKEMAIIHVLYSVNSLYIRLSELKDHVKGFNFKEQELPAFP